MKCQKYIARCYHVYQHERNENASFLSIFKGGGRPKWRFSNFSRFWKNSSALRSFNCIFENNSLKSLFGQNIKKVKILKLSLDSRYLQKLALNNKHLFGVLYSRGKITIEFRLELNQMFSCGTSQINQSINQSINRSIDHSINQSINQSNCLMANAIIYDVDPRSMLEWYDLRKTHANKSWDIWRDSYSNLLVLSRQFKERPFLYS